MPSCAAFGCTNSRDKKIPGISYHRFPKNPRLREDWIRACRRKNWTPSNHSILCCKHFSLEQMDYTSLNVVRLRENAVPNIFTYTPLKKRAVKKIRRVKNNNTVASTGPVIDEKFVDVKPAISSIAINNTASLDSDQTEQIVCNSTEETMLPVFREKMDNNLASTGPVIDKKFVDVKPDISSIATNNVASRDSDETEQNFSNWTEETILPIFQEKMDNETDTNSDEETNSVLENELGNSDECFKEKFENLTARYKKSQTKLKQCQKQCKVYLKEITTLKKVLNSLRQIISVTDENYFKVKS